MQTSGAGTCRSLNRLRFKPTLFSEAPEIVGYLNSKFIGDLVNIINPTINLEVGDVAKIPFANFGGGIIGENAKKAIEISAADWNEAEISWGYDKDKLLKLYANEISLSGVINIYIERSNSRVDSLREIEESNNKMIGAQLLDDTSSFSVEKQDITLFCNPRFRYKANENAFVIWKSDIISDLVSYAVGCMFGRYSIDKNGLILANQGSTLADYLAQVPHPRFEPDADNCIPIFDEDWFADDIVTRFREFVRVTFGVEHYAENMAFIEKTLNVKNKKGWTIRDYFSKDFYEDHVKRYRKRPIYWLFTSPKGSFKCLIYLHRYNRSTVGVVLNSYLRNFMQKLQTFIELADKTMDNPQATAREQSAALKNKAKFSKMLDELRAYERDVLYPLAQESIELDLDDGVKVNYLKFGSALKKIPGLAGKDE